MNEATEQLWIECVKENNDSSALVNLVEKYQPMVNNLRSQFFINNYEANDWYQDALLVCYQTCLIFDGNSGSKFGSFFKLRFKNYIVDCIRRDNAHKRRANIGTKPLESVPLAEQADVGAINDSSRIIIQKQLQEVLVEFSELELLAFQYLIGKLSKEDLQKQTKYDMKKIDSAIYRAQAKLHKGKSSTDLS